MLKPKSRVEGREPVEYPCTLPELKPDSGSAYGRYFLIIHGLDAVAVNDKPWMKEPFKSLFGNT